MARLRTPLLAVLACLAPLAAPGQTVQQLCDESDPRLEAFLCSPRHVEALALAVVRCQFSNRRQPDCAALATLPGGPDAILDILPEAAAASPLFADVFGRMMRRVGHRSFSAMQQCSLRLSLGIGCRTAIVQERNAAQVAVHARLARTFPVLETVIGDQALVLTSLVATCILDHDVGRNRDCAGFFDPYIPDAFVQVARARVRHFETRYPALLDEKLANLARHLATCAAAIELDRVNPCDHVQDAESLRAEMARFDRFGGFGAYRALFDAARARGYEWTVDQLALSEAGKRIMVYRCDSGDAALRADVLDRILAEFPALGARYRETLARERD